MYNYTKIEKRFIKKYLKIIQFNSKLYLRKKEGDPNDER